jgi:hypothetical protein
MRIRSSTSADKTGSREEAKNYEKFRLACFKVAVHKDGIRERGREVRWIHDDFQYGSACRPAVS